MQTLSATQPFHRRPRPLTRCKGSEGKQTALRTCGTLADGFLKHCFLPVYEPSPDTPQKKNVEAVFFKSVRNISDYYQLTPIDTDSFAYPYNILLANWDISRKMKVKGRYRELCMEETDTQSVEIVVTESVITNSTLYYIPLMPLYRSLVQGANPCTKLLLGVCVYLYRKAGVCHYKDEDSYLCYLYDIMTNWIEDDREGMDDADYNHQRATMDEIFAVGDQMEVYLGDESYLLNLQGYIGIAEPRSKFEKNCTMLAKETLALWTEFPTANLYQNLAIVDVDDEEEYDSHGKISVNDYISFIGETSSCVYDSMMTMLNEDFNERSGIQDFEHRMVFNNKPRKRAPVLVYEERLLEIIENLCELLNQLP